MPVIVKCHTCEQDIKMKPSKVKDRNFCNRECYFKYKGRNKKHRVCYRCGKEYVQQHNRDTERNFCSKPCHMKTMNEENNPLKMTDEYKVLVRHYKIKYKYGVDIDYDMEVESKPIDEITLDEITKIAEYTLAYCKDKGIDPNHYPVFRGLKLHRLVAEKKIGRKLLPEEVVHHINEDKHDARPENLHVFASQEEHTRHHAYLRSIGMYD